MAKSPLRAARLHMLPDIRQPTRLVSSRPIAYVCRRAIPGMQLTDRLSAIKNQWVYGRRKPSITDGHPADTGLTTITSTIGDFTITMDWSEWIGGRPVRIRVQDTSDGYDILLLNNISGQGREINWVSGFYGQNDVNSPVDRFTRNPESGGSMIGAFGFSQEGDPFPGYSQQNKMQGAPVIRFQNRDLGGGSNETTSISLPMDWNSAHAPHQNGEGLGSIVDPILFPECPVFRKVTTNWNGNKGIIRFLTGGLYPRNFYLYGRVHFGTGFHCIWGWDEQWLFDTTHGWNLMTDVAVLNGLTSPTLTSANSVNDTVAIRFQSDQGRTAKDFHRVQLTGFGLGDVDSFDINGDHGVTWESGTHFNIGLPGSGTQNFGIGGAAVTSPDLNWAEWSDRQARLIWKNRFEITDSKTPLAGISKRCIVDSTGKNMVSGGRSAVAYRSRNPGVESWSYGEDFAWAFYKKAVTDRPPEAANTRSGQLELDGSLAWNWNSVREAATPTNGEKVQNAVIFCEAQEWHMGEKNFVRGWHGAEVYFLVVGTWAEVQASIATLEAMDDSIFDVPRDVAGNIRMM